MMHDSVLHWLARLPLAEIIPDSDVLEAGSYDVNGSVRPLISTFGPRSYVGTDIRPGPGVDTICDAADYPASRQDVVISTEMLEHAEYWERALIGMRNALRPDGLLILTTRGPGFSRHDHPGDYWRFTPHMLADALTGNLGMILEWLQPDPDHPGVFVMARRPEYSTTVDYCWPEALPPR